MLWLQDKTIRSHSPHIRCARNGSASLQWWDGHLPSLRLQTTYNTGLVQSHFTSDCTARQTTYNTGSVQSHFTSDCTVRQTTYNTGSDQSHFTSDCTVRRTTYKNWLRSIPLYLRLHSTPNYIQNWLSSIQLYLRLHSTPNYIQHWLRSIPLYLRLHSTPVTKNVTCYSNHALFRRRHPHNVNISLRPSFIALKTHAAIWKATLRPSHCRKICMVTYPFPNRSVAIAPVTKHNQLNACAYFKILLPLCRANS